MVTFLCSQDPAVTQHRPSSEYATLDVYNPFENPGQREPPPYESRPSVPPAPPLPAPQLPKKTSPTEPRNYGSYGTQGYRQGWGVEDVLEKGQD
uniref:Uncharacterized protein n=1 Tax=Sphaerodactylus townsendi TaxID=933632 RepID=A0ACB8G7A1_9SAUR